MKVSKLNNPNKFVTLNFKQYKINWNSDSCSKIQTRAKNLLEPYWKNYLVGEEVRLPGSLLRLDFLNFSNFIAIEIDPIEHHDNYNPFFHQSRAGYLRSIKSGISKEKWCEQNKITLLRLNEFDLDWFSPKYIELNYKINIV